MKEPKKKKKKKKKKKTTDFCFVLCFNFHTKCVIILIGARIPRTETPNSASYIAKKRVADC